MSDDYTQAARAEAERHYPALNADDETLTYPRSAVREHARGGFVKGYEAGWAAALAAGRAETTTANANLTAEQCPDHKPRQHRDGKPPWCRTCGLTKDGATPTSTFERHR